MKGDPHWLFNLISERVLFVSTTVLLAAGIAVIFMIKDDVLGKRRSEQIASAVNDPQSSEALKLFRTCKTKSGSTDQLCEIEALSLMWLRGKDTKQGAEAIQRYIAASQNWL